MTQLLNTLFVTTQGAYVHLENDAISVEVDHAVRQRIPLHHIGSVVTFGNVLVSPYLVGRLTREGKTLSLHDRNGRFWGRVHGPTHGNVLLRQDQYDTLHRPEKSLQLAAAVVEGKIKNAYSLLMRSARECDGDDETVIREAAKWLDHASGTAYRAENLDALRGYEGEAAHFYFAALEKVIKPDVRDGFRFESRNRRPPRDRMNALLSFLYTLVMNDCVAACEGVGLDPQVGYLHALRPGKAALALDLMEEFRAPLADKLALTLINRRQIQEDDFENRPGGAVYLNDDGRKSVVVAYQKHKQEEITHPLLKEKVPVGLLTHIQARIFARALRGDIERYVPMRFKS